MRAAASRSASTATSATSHGDERSLRGVFCSLVAHMLTHVRAQGDSGVRGARVCVETYS